MKNNKFLFFKSFLFIFFIFFIAFGSLFIIKNFIAYPMGADIFGYLFRTSFLYDSIKSGDFFPIYTQYWYNGTEMFQSWPPLAYYVQVLFTFITNGNVLNSYYLFIIFCFVLSSLGWLLFGIREKRIGICFVFALIYFFLPDNLRVMLSEGNIARLLLMALFPYFFFFVMEFIHYKKKYALIMMSIFIFLITITHFMIAALLGISLFLYLLFYATTTKDYKNSLICLFNAIFAYIPTAICLVPGVFGGVLGLGSSADSELAMWTEDLAITINPFERFQLIDSFYIGTVIFVFLILGIICYRQKSYPFFITSVIIYALTSSELIPIFKMLPLSQMFWTKRLVPIFYILALLGILYWKKLKKSVLVLLILFMTLDLLPSLKFFEYNENNEGFLSSEKIDNYIDDYAKELLLDKAVSITSNRLMIVDESSFGSIPSFYLYKNNKTSFVSGWGFQGAAIRDNIVRLTEAFQYGYFTYTFDRLIELGADTVILKKGFVEKKDLKKLNETANELGYYLVDENEEVLLYKLKDIDYTYGTITNYKYLAIGKSSFYVEYLYPCFIQGKSDYIDDYSIEYLKKYEKIYLAGFEYHNKEKAEKIIQELAEENIKIFIDMNNIPKNLVSGKNDFLGVTAQEVYFTDKFPVLEIRGNKYKLDFKTNRYSNWLAVYLTGVDTVKASSFYAQYPNLTYWGVDDTGNINFLGFNLLYYCVENKTDELMWFFDEVFEISEGKTPYRKFTEIEVTYNNIEDKVYISSKEDNVSTNLSLSNCFIENNNYWEINNLINMNEGDICIDIKYPMFNISLIISIMGMFILIIYWIIIFKILKQKR